MASALESTTRIAQLSDIIRQSTDRLDSLLAAKGHPSPSFDQNSPGSYPVETDDVRDKILDATAELYDLVMEPMAMLYKKTGHNNMICLQAITRFEIADMIPVDGELSFAEIAAQIEGLSESMVRRLLRHAFTLRVFRENTQGKVTHTKASRALTNPVMNAWLRNGTHEMWPAAVKMIDALQKWPNSSEPSETGFALANGQTASVFEILSSDSTRAARFGKAMSIYATKPEYSASFLTDHYDWASLGHIHVVALGAGSHLQVMTALTRRFENITVTVQDAAAIVSQHQDTVAADLVGRLRFASHDLFAPQATRGDVLLLRWTLHLWSNEYCKKILRAQIPVLNAGIKIIIQDSCMPEPGTIPLWREQDLRASDIHMANIFNGQERTIQEWTALFEEADPRFVVRDVIEPRGSALGIIEVGWEE